MMLLHLYIVFLVMFFLFTTEASYVRTSSKAWPPYPDDQPQLWHSTVQLGFTETLKPITTERTLFWHCANV